MEMTVHINTLDRVTQVWIQDETRRTGASVEQVIARLIQRGVAIERQAARVQRYHDVDHLAGTWSAEEADTFRSTLADFAQIEPGLWR